MADLVQTIQLSAEVLGEAIRHIGDKNSPTTLTITGQVWDSGNFPVADAYTAADIWAGGQGGLSSFEYAIFLADADMWVEFANTTPNPDERVTFFVKAGAILLVPSAQIGAYGNNTTRLDGSVLVAATDYGAINFVRVQNNTPAGTGTATCRLVLIK